MRSPSRQSSSAAVRRVTAITFAMEEFVDAVLNIAMARQEVDALRVMPQLKVKFVVALVAGIGVVYGWLRVAMLVTS